MFKIVRKRKASFPGLLLAKPIWEDIGAIASKGISQNILEQKQVDNSPIRTNSQNWQKRKRKLGFDSRSLIAKSKSFVKHKGSAGSSFPYEIKKNSIVFKPSASIQSGGHTNGSKKVSLSDLAIWVQRKGYTGWFGLREKTIKLVRSRIRKFIIDEFKKAAAKR